MPARALPSRTPYALALRWLVHVLLYLLVVVVALRTLGDLPSASALARLALLVLLVSVYSIGARRAAGRGADHRGSWRALGHLLPAVLAWAACLALTPDATWIAFGLDFAVLYALPLTGGIVGLVLVTGIAVGGFAAWQGALPVAGVVGPVIGALVALAVVLAVRALQEEIDERTRLARDLLAAQEDLARTQRDAARAEERTRIARELHDTVAQSALSIQMLLDASRTSLEAGDSPTALGHLGEARRTAALTSRQTRSFVDQDATDEREGMDLVERLRGVIAEMAPAAEAAPDVSLRCELAPGTSALVPARTASGLERILRSLLGNVLQHADAARAVATLSAQDGDLVLDVVDDGVGMATENPGDAAGGFGLRTVRARARALGGGMAIESSPGQGTAVQVRVPLGAPPPAGEETRTTDEEGEQR
ncbi:sensor histidine kinase [Brachybacterium sp. ACRRE]|uniref:sensor histidine kinase n=1 Tax=Brachybacterium sp. ACRRE TaxID=2918184 RepID=UPI001EF2D0B6|nr:ATP-binding protein [Brachybacterium sp. ACRRE]MCG7308598.1 histidine kinase [Brachybacterium sp. ACRRE]